MKYYIRRDVRGSLPAYLAIPPDADSDHAFWTNDKDLATPFGYWTAMLWKFGERECVMEPVNQDQA